MKSRAVIEVRADAELCRKAAAVAQHEGLTLNNYFIKLMRSSVAYHERVHGKIDTSSVTLPEAEDEKL